MEAPLALYRRYRPETFSEVIGQDHVTAPLRNALSNNRVNHAYLFSGPRGCGKTTSARILARAINCEKGPIAEPCGVCQSCTDLARGGPGSIDVIEIDAASHGGVDDARDLRERAFFSPVQSRYKIYIIDEAHMVTTQGFNALLKLVEEPPPHLKFIFATTEPDKVIGTIRSRTHHYPFRLVPPKVLGDYMAMLCQAEGVTIAPAALPLVVRAGAGSVRDSLSVLDQLIGGAGPDGVTYELTVSLLGFTPDSLLDACVDGFAAHDSRAVFETIEKVIETGQDPKRFAEDLLRRLRDLVILSAVPNAVASGLIEAAEDQGERLQTQAAGIGAAELTRAADIVAAGLLEMRGATAPRLQLELICAKVLLPGADDSTNGIQARLDRMERRLTIGAPAVGTTSSSAASTASPPAAVAPPTQAAPAPRPSVPPANSAAPTSSAPGASAPAPTPAPGDSGPASTADPVGAGPSSAAAAPASAAPGSARGGRDSAGASSPTEQGGRTGAWPDESASPQPASSAPAASVAPAAPATVPASAPAGVPASSGAVGLGDVRRLWPEILEAVKAKRRFAWIMLSQNAQVIAIDEQILTLGLVNAGARESFARSGSDEILRQAMVDTIGLDRRVEAVVDPSTDPSAAAPPAPSTPSSSSWDQSAPATMPSAGATQQSTQNNPVNAPNSQANASTQPGTSAPAGSSPPPAHNGDGGPAGSTPPGAPGPNSHSSNAAGTATTPGATANHPISTANHPGGGAVAVQEAPARSESSVGGAIVVDQAPPLQADQQAGGPPAPTATPDTQTAERQEQVASKRRAAEAAVAAEQASRAAAAPVNEAPLTPEQEAEAIGEDDVVLEEDSRSHTDLLRDTLGAQIITEEPN